MNQQLDPAAVAEIKRLLEYRNVIQAIKVYRVATGCGLKDAKDGVDRLHSQFHEMDPQRFGSTTGGDSGSSAFAMRALIFVVIAIVLGMCWFLLTKPN